MKKSALQFTKAYVYDVQNSNEGNIAEHLLLSAQSEQNGFFCYLTDEEIEKYENFPQSRIEFENEVEVFLNENFNFDFKDFEY